MGSPIALRGDFDGPGLHRLAKTTKDAAQARRLLELAGIYDGGSRMDAARIGGVTRQVVRDWVLRFNTWSEGLINGKVPGNRPKLSEDQRQALGQDGGERSHPGHPWHGALATQGLGALAL